MNIEILTNKGFITKTYEEGASFVKEYNTNSSKIFEFIAKNKLQFEDTQFTYSDDEDDTQFIFIFEIRTDFSYAQIVKFFHFVNEDERHIVGFYPLGINEAEEFYKYMEE